MEGIVTRDAQSFSLDDFSHRVFKYVRKDQLKQMFIGKKIGDEPL